MKDPEDVLANSPADFDSSFAYALHSEMRRLIIVTVVGSLLLPIGLGMFFNPGFLLDTSGEIINQLIGLALALVGAVLFYGGLVGVLFKIVTDANIISQAAIENE
jgi:hypothetical protein